MADFLLELLMEEIPSRFQDMASIHLKNKLIKSLQEEKLSFNSLETYITPRRLVAYIQGLPEKKKDIQERRKGPRVDAPEKAIKGFLKSLNLELTDCKQETMQKGVFWVVDVLQKGKPTACILENIIKDILETFSWPKSMRWGNKMGKWIRPLRNMIAIFDGKVLDIEWNGVKSSNKTQGHRILFPNFFKVDSWKSYKDGLQKRQVILNKKDKIERIYKGIEALAKESNTTVYKADRLVNEVAGLVEYPWFLKGTFDKNFLKLPVEALETTMRVHQRYFLLYKAGKPSTSFVVVTNMPTDDKYIENTMREGNEKVLKARLEDASFYWKLDQKTALSEFSLKLKERLFHKELGTMWQKKERLEKLIVCSSLLDYLKENKINKEEAQKAAELCKADLCTGMVAEFPELQGIMGGYYACLEGYSKLISKAISEHYSPTGTEEFCPEKPLSVILSLVDKIDTLLGFFAIELEPTGSKDPFALRRAALGLLRLTLNNGLDFNLKPLLEKAYSLYVDQGLVKKGNIETCMKKVQTFLSERLRYYFKDKGHNHKVIEGVLAKGSQHSIVRVEADLKAIENFLKTEKGALLLQNYRRVSNILRAKKHKVASNFWQEDKLGEKAEKELLSAVKNFEQEAKEDQTIEQQLDSLTFLQKPIDQFFEDILVNDPDEDKKNNRFLLLAKVQRAFDKNLSFSSLVG